MLLPSAERGHSIEVMFLFRPHFISTPSALPAVRNTDVSLRVQRYRVPNDFVRKTRDNWTGNWWKPAEKRRTNYCEVNWTGVHRQMNNSVCHFDRTRIDKWTILTVSVETKPGWESVEVMCFLSLIDCLQRETLSTKPGQEPTTGKRNGSFSLSSKTSPKEWCFRGGRVTNRRWGARIPISPQAHQPDLLAMTNFSLAIHSHAIFPS